MQFYLVKMFYLPILLTRQAKTDLVYYIINDILSVFTFHDIINKNQYITYKYILFFITLRPYLKKQQISFF